jgi:hydroxymethylpyrimidine pyrophosphatase-like HAD family hydrolase
VDLGNRFTRVVSGIPGFASATIDNETLIQTESSSVNSSWSPPLRAVREFPDFQEEAPRILTVQGGQMVEAVKTAFASEPPEQLLMLDSKGPTGETVLTLTTSAASKGNCLRVACSALNRSPDAVIAFGDSEGDLDLFETAGLSVAMGQALPSVRNAADCVTDANYENGIATFLDAYFEGKFNDAS